MDLTEHNKALNKVHQKIFEISLNNIYLGAAVNIAPNKTKPPIIQHPYDLQTPCCKLEKLNKRPAFHYIFVAKSPLCIKRRR